MFQNLMQYIRFLILSLVYDWELFLIDIKLVVAVYMVVQKLEIVLSNFTLYLFQSNKFHTVT